MRSLVNLLRFSVTLCVAALAGGCVTAQTSSSTKYQLMLIGDSTMASRNGYGDALCAKTAPEVRCLNLAMNGRSSRSFREEGRWASALAIATKEPSARTVMLIQFGHNDQPGKPGRSTDLAVEFPRNVSQYVSEAQKVGALPILVTPLTRRKFGSDGVLINDLAPWAQIVREQAAQLRVPLIDLNQLSYEAVAQMGSTQADLLAEEPPPTKPLSDGVKTRFDYTHLGEKGAALFSSMMASELVKTMPELIAPSQARR